MLAFRFTSHHDPHLATRWCVTFVFLRNGSFVMSAKVLHMVGYAIDQHHLRTDYPINLFFAKSGGASAIWCFDSDRFSNLVYITSDFRWRRFGVYALHVLLTLVYTIRRCIRRCFIIFGYHIIPVHCFCYWAMWPHGYSLDSEVILLCNAITFWDISTLVSHLYAPFVSENEGKSGYKKLGHYPSVFQLVCCVQRRRTSVLARIQLVPQSEMWQPTIGQCQESIATVMGYVHTQPMPVISHFYSSFFPPGRS